MEVRGRIDEADVGKLGVGQIATFTVDAYPDRSFKGRVLEIRKSPEMTQNVVTYTAVISGAACVNANSNPVVETRTSAVVRTM